MDSSAPCSRECGITVCRQGAATRGKAKRSPGVQKLRPAAPTPQSLWRPLLLGPPSQPRGRLTQCVRCSLGWGWEEGEVWRKGFSHRAKWRLLTSRPCPNFLRSSLEATQKAKHLDSVYTDCPSFKKSVFPSPISFLVPSSASSCARRGHLSLVRLFGVQGPGALFSRGLLP